MSSEPSTIHVRFMHFLSLVLVSVSAAFSAFCLYVSLIKNYSYHPALKGMNPYSDEAWSAKRLVQHREMTDLTEVALFWSGLVLVCVILSLASYYVIKGSVRQGDRKVYDKAFTLYVCCVLLPLAAAFLMYTNLPYVPSL